jgi:predicted metal-dependent peptidase
MTSELHDAQATKRCEQALRLVCADMPHLAGLAQAVRFSPRDDIKTAGVFASGRLVFNSKFVLELSWRQITFVMAHELLHLALETHYRGAGSDAILVNVAHDLIINDQLIAELGDPQIPGILRFAGARHHSLEKMLFFLRRSTPPAPGWPSSGRGLPETPIGRALREAGLLPETVHVEGDVLDANLESQWYPDEATGSLDDRTANVRELSGQARSLETFLDHFAPASDRPGVPESKRRRIEAQAEAPSAPWEQVMQRWLDAVTPAARTYVRTSRRGGDRTDIVLPGRNRDNWTLHVVLDTSGSMYEHLPHALAALAEGCRSVGAERIHVVQCDVAIRREEWLTPEQLERLEIEGFAGYEGAVVPEELPPPVEEPSAPEEKPEPPPVEPPPAADVQPPPAASAAPAWSPAPPAPVWDVSPSSTPRYYNDPPHPYYPPTPDKPLPIKCYGVLPGLGRVQHSGRGVKGSNKRKPRSRRQRPSPFERERQRHYASWSDFVRDESTPPPPMHAMPEDSDLTAALQYLAADASVEAVVVLSDGYAGYPLEAPPFHTLWLVPFEAHRDQFQPPYGQVVALRE